MLKNLDSKNMQVVYNHPYFKLIRIAEEGKENLKPIIFINGQIEHHLQAMETATKATYPWCYQYSWYYNYDDEVHTPYIFLYDYPIYGIDRTKVTNEEMALGLKMALKELKLDNVDIMGESNGGMIGILCSKDERIDNVVAIHTPIYGAPCLNFPEYDKLLKYLNLKEKLVLKAMKLITDPKFGYMQLNRVGFNDIAKEGAIEKIYLPTSNIIKTPSKHQLGMILANMHYKYLGLATDGVITVDEERMNKDGLNYTIEDGRSHFEMGKAEYTNNYYQRLVRHK